MPSQSKAQHNFMEMVAHDPKAAKRVGVPMSVGKDFVSSDKSKGKNALANLPKYKKRNVLSHA